MLSKSVQRLALSRLTFEHDLRKTRVAGDFRLFQHSLFVLKIEIEFLFNTSLTLLLLDL